MTLIEVLVAFIVLSLTMAVIMQIFSGGMRNARLADSYSRAVFLAESKLAAAGVEQPLTPGEVSGRLGSDLNWRVATGLYDDDGAGERLMLQSRLYQVRVFVDWNESGKLRRIELATLRMGPKQ